MEKDENQVLIRREFHLGRPLGEGGMAKVVEGFEPGLGAHAAVKILHEDLLDVQEVRERFDEESRIMASIGHPGCLPIYGWGVDGHGRPFYAMKQLRGKTLTSLLKAREDNDKSLVWRRRLLHVFQSVCETVAYAHEQGIVHRDLKPDNIMIDDFGSVYVIDWGIAKRLGGDEGTDSRPRTRVGSVMGSPGYMAPEQVEGQTRQAGPEADTFALGVILYEILTGANPFEGETEREAMAYTVHHEPADPRRKNFLVGRSIAAVCLKALHKDPARRYRSAGQLAEDIQAYNEGRKVAVAKPSPAERLVFWIRRDPVRSALSLAAGVAIATAALIVGTQVWIDTQLAEKTRDRVKLINEDIAELDDEIDAMRLRITSTEGRKKEEFDLELRTLETRRLFRGMAAINALSNVRLLRFIRSDPRLDEDIRTLLFSILEANAETSNALLIHGIVESLLEDIEEGKSAVDYSLTEIKRLQDYRGRAEKAAGL